MFNTTYQDPNEVQLCTDKDRMILQAIRKIEQAGGGCLIRRGKGQKGGATIMRVLDLSVNPLINLTPDECTKLLDKKILVEDDEQEPIPFTTRYKINSQKIIKA